MHKITGSDGFVTMPVREDDLLDFATTMADWPADKEGTFSIQRSMMVLSMHTRNNRLAKCPAVKGVQSNLTMAYKTPNNEWVGYWRMEIAGLSASITQAAIHPDYRGKGNFTRMEHARWWYTWNVLGIETVEWETMRILAAPVVKVSGRYGGTQDSTRARWNTGEDILHWKVTKAQAEAFDADPVAPSSGLSDVTYKVTELG